MPRPCGFCHQPGHSRKTCAKRKAADAAKAYPCRAPGCKARFDTREAVAAHGRIHGRASASAATLVGSTPPPQPPSPVVPPSADTLHAIRQARELCEARARSFAEAAENLKAVEAIESALAGSRAS